MNAALQKAIADAAESEDYVRRAMGAWFRSGNTTLPTNYSCVYQAGGRDYVELCNVNGTLAVYRIDIYGRLKRLKRWPSAKAKAERLPIEDYAAAAFGSSGARA